MLARPLRKCLDKIPGGKMSKCKNSGEVDVPLDRFYSSGKPGMTKEPDTCLFGPVRLARHAASRLEDMNRRYVVETLRMGLVYISRT